MTFLAALLLTAAAPVHPHAQPPKTEHKQPEKKPDEDFSKTPKRLSGYVHTGAAHNVLAFVNTIGGIENIT